MDLDKKKKKESLNFLGEEAMQRERERERTALCTSSRKEGVASGVGETVLKLAANRHKLSRFLKTPKKVAHLMKQ